MAVGSDDAPDHQRAQNAREGVRLRILAMRMNMTGENSEAPCTYVWATAVLTRGFMLRPKRLVFRSVP